MKPNSIPRKNRLEFFNESLFSLNIGFGISYALFAYVTISHLPVYAPEGLQRLLRAFATFLLRIAPLVASVPPQVHRRSMFIWEFGFVASTLTIALVVLGIRRMLSGTRLGAALLNPLAGITALALVPGCWFYIVEVTQLEPGMRHNFVATYGLFFALEVILMATLVYLLGQRSLWSGMLIFTIHYLVCMSVMLVVTGPPNITSLLISPIFPLSGIMWLRDLQIRDVEGSGH